MANITPTAIFLELLLFGSIVPTAHGQTSNPNRPLVGAIRWDGWSGGTVGLAGEKELGALKWHYRVPFFGQVISDSQVSINGGSQAVMDQEIAYAKTALDYWAFVTYDAVETRNRDSELSIALQYYLSSTHKQDIRFCMLTDQPRWAGEQHRWAINRVIPLMKESTYQKVLDSRPLFYLGFIDDASIARDWGSMAGFRKGVDDFRAAAQNAGAGNPYVVTMDFDPVRALSLSQQLGGDAISAYALSNTIAPGLSYLSLASRTENLWEQYRATESQVIPLLMSGWDRRPRVENPEPWEPSQKPGVGIQYFYEAPKPAELAGHLTKAFAWINDHPNSDKANAVLFYAWNENTEGGWLVPTLSEGAARLDALHDVVTSQRTTLSLNSTSTQAAGKLTDSSGRALTGASVAISITPLTGSGFPATYSVQGTIPDGTQVIDFGARVNVDCNCSGTADLLATSFQVTPGSGNPIVLDFSHQFNGWAVGPSGGAMARIVGNSLHITAQPSQMVYLDTAKPNIPFTGSGSFQFRVDATVSPISVGSGQFAVYFLTSAGAELGRAEIPFQPATIPLGTAQTGSDGSFIFPIPSQFQVPGSFRVQASYAGTASRLPALFETTIDATLSIDSVVNGATFKFEPLAPGTWFTVFGNYLGQAAQWTTTNTVSLGGASVSVCGLQAVISYNSGLVTPNSGVGWQLNVLMPDGVAGETSCPVVVSVDGYFSRPVNVSIASGILELFSFTSVSSQLPIVTHADYSLVGPNSAGQIPANPGESVIAWGTGNCSVPTVTVGGKPAIVLFSGQVGPGLCQLNFTVPNGLSGIND